MDRQVEASTKTLKIHTTNIHSILSAMAIQFQQLYTQRHVNSCCHLTGPSRQSNYTHSTHTEHTHDYQIYKRSPSTTSSTTGLPQCITPKPATKLPPRSTTVQWTIHSLHSHHGPTYLMLVLSSSLQIKFTSLTHLRSQWFLCYWIATLWELRLPCWMFALIKLWLWRFLGTWWLDGCYLLTHGTHPYVSIQLYSFLFTFWYNTLSLPTLGRIVQTIHHVSTQQQHLSHSSTPKKIQHPSQKISTTIPSISLYHHNGASPTTMQPTNVDKPRPQICNHTKETRITPRYMSLQLLAPPPHLTYDDIHRKSQKVNQSLLDL